MNAVQERETIKKLKEQRDEARAKVEELERQAARSEKLTASAVELAVKTERAAAAKELEKSTAEILVAADTLNTVNTGIKKIHEENARLKEQNIALNETVVFNDVKLKDFDSSKQLRARLHKRSEELLETRAERDAARNITQALLKKSPMILKNGMYTWYNGDLAAILSSAFSEDPALQALGKRYTKELSDYRDQLVAKLEEDRKKAEATPPLIVPAS